jgi:phage antirepressor YoqD-like protein
MGMKLFQIRTNTVIGADGRQFVNHVTLVTGKGQTYFVNKFLAKAQEVAA